MQIKKHLKWNEKTRTPTKVPPTIAARPGRKPRIPPLCSLPGGDMNNMYPDWPLADLMVVIDQSIVPSGDSGIHGTSSLVGLFACQSGYMSYSEYSLICRNWFSKNMAD